MPTTPRSHVQRQGRTLSDQRYDRTVRPRDPALRQAKQVRSSARWRAVRALVLRQHPLCADPYGVHAQHGRIEVATQVDHVVPLAQGGGAYDLQNLQALCTRCHAVKSKRESL